MSAAVAISAQQSRYTRVKTPRLDIVHQLAALMTFFKKRHCYPSQKEIRKRIAEHCHWECSLRTLNRHLKGLEQDGMIERVRRHRRVEGKGMEMHSTLYKLTKKAWLWIAKLFPAAKVAISWGRERVTHLSEYIPLRGRIIPAAGPADAARRGEPQKSPPNGGGGNKKTSTLDTQRKINATKPTATGFSTLQFLKRSLQREHR